MSYGTRELHARLFMATAMSNGQIYASAPIKTDFLRWGTIHLLSSLNETSGGSFTVYGSNVYPVSADGRAVDETERGKYSATLGVPVNGGVIPNLTTALAKWINSGIVLPIQPGPAQINGVIALNPFDFAWLLLVATPMGSLTLDAWLKMKSSG